MRFLDIPIRIGAVILISCAAMGVLVVAGLAFVLIAIFDPAAHQ